MPATTACVHCKKVGFVRSEHVVRGPVSYIEYFCGACEHSWRIAEGSQSAPERTAGDKPDRSRR